MESPEAVANGSGNGAILGGQIIGMEELEIDELHGDDDDVL